MNRLVLSLFSGIDLFGKGFVKNKFCVVSAGDKFLGSDVRNFHAPSGVFDGVIGGSPCQDFSRLNRNPKNYSHEMLEQFIRVVTDVQSIWFLHENVVGVPEFEVAGYRIQRFELDLSWFGVNSTRRRIFTFGVKESVTALGALNPIIKTNPTVTNRAITCGSDLPLKEMAKIQGCDFLNDLEHFTVKGKKTVIGNAVPLVMSEYLAKLIDDAIYQSVTTPGNKCECGCGRIVTGKSKTAHQNCRKKKSRKLATVTLPVQKNCDGPGAVLS
jgi:DNA (cytosine-5)-methyltransferase 1